MRWLCGLSVNTARRAHGCGSGHVRAEDRTPAEPPPPGTDVPKTSRQDPGGRTCGAKRGASDAEEGAFRMSWLRGKMKF